MKTKEKEIDKLCFYTTGEGMTNIIRDSWISRKVIHAMKLCTEGMGMNTEQAIQLVTGKKKLVGDTRENDGTLSFENDNKTEQSGIPLDIEYMNTKLENEYISLSESLLLEIDMNVKLKDEYELECSDETIKSYRNRIESVSIEIYEIYRLQGHKNKKLPVEKIRTVNQIKPGFGIGKINNEVEEEEVENPTEDKESKRSKPFYTSIGNNKYYIVHTSTEKCKTEGLHSGWLLPDGTFFGGRGIFIHRGILDTLDEYDYFQDKPCVSDEDSVTDTGNWIKLSDSNWMLHEYRQEPTKEQVEFIIAYTINVCETNFINIYGTKKIHVQVFAEILNGKEFDSYEMEKESKGMDELKKSDDFPTVQEVSGIDFISTPFFVPDDTFVKWLIKYANGRVIVDCGAGSGYLCALIHKNGWNAIGVEPQWNMERKLFWMKHGFMFNVFQQTVLESMVMDYPAEKVLFIFARPCHSGFVYNTIQKLKKGSEILYISHKNNVETRIDLGNLKYTQLEHEGTSVDNEIVLCIKK